MRKTLIIAILFLLLLLFGSSAMVLAFVRIAPFHAEQALFPIQENLEHALLVFYFDPTSKASYELDLLEKRIQDMEQVEGQVEEIPRINSVLIELDHVINRFQFVSAESESNLREEFVKELNSIQDKMLLYTFLAETYPQEFNTLQAKIAGLKFLAMDVSNPLSALFTLSQGENSALEQANDPSDSSNQEPDFVDPRMVPFLPGSAGASHAFFPLTGKHAELTCQNCHSNMTYAGTPNQCAVCHSNVVPINHFDGMVCSTCHTTSAWKPASFDHAAVGATDCQSCHSGDKPNNHFSGQCSSCHNTNAWKPASFDHAVAGATDCQGCHSGNKPNNHFSGQCSSCHNTNAWKPANLDHAAAGLTDCQGCHSGNKPNNHFSGQCSSCHNTNAWKPANLDHAAAGLTDCQGCHSGNKPNNHFSGQCSSCHTTNAWKPASFSHANAGATDCQSCHSGDKPNNHFSGQCSSCHNTNSWGSASFSHSAAGATDCQGCHSGDKPNNHFSGQCSSCHNTDSWESANFSHSFPLNHGNANSVCAQCHPSGGTEWTCFNCHNENELTHKHQEEGISNFVVRCMECHSDGRKHDD